MPSNQTRSCLIDWKYSSIDVASRVIFQINPNGSPNWQSVRNYIMDLSTKYAMEKVAKCQNPEFMGTGGWYVSFFESESDDYDYGVEVTIMPHLVADACKVNCQFDFDERIG